VQVRARTRPLFNNGGDKLAICFHTVGKTLRVRPSGDPLEARGRCLLDRAKERRLHGDV
jgi:hypothetical protein